MKVRNALFFEVLFIWWVGKRRSFVGSRLMMKSHFCPGMMIIPVQDEHVKVKIDPCVRDLQRSKKRRIHKRPSVVNKSPAISKLNIPEEISLSRLRGMCDLCMEPPARWSYAGWSSCHK